MRKLLLTLLLSSGIVLSIFAQDTFLIQDSTPLTINRWRDTCFGLLDKSAVQIPSGILLDYSLNPFNDSCFNSLVSSRIDTIQDGGLFFTACNILKSAVVNSNGNSIPNSDSVYVNAARYMRNNGAIPLLFLYTTFQKINSSSYSQNLLTITPDSIRLKDVPGRSASPYKNGLFFAFAPFQTTITQFNTINFTLPSQFWMMPGITSVQIDFGDGGGFRTLNQNGSISIYYSTPGTYCAVAKINTSNGLLTAKCNIVYKRPSSYIKGDTVWNISVAPLYTSITDYINKGGVTFAANMKTNSANSIQPLGSGAGPSCSDGNVFDQINCDINPGATVTILNGCDRVFDKPIIIVEGFDPSNSTSASTLQDQFDYRTGSTPGFVTSMRNLGYDFVFVVFTKNHDFIENNAMVLEQVILKVNQFKTGTNKNTVIGYSMGGLIARYALRDMEVKTISHNVQNYFSYDAPQQGANVPIGMQCLFNELLMDAPALKYVSQLSNLYNAFGSPAAQEMLVTYADYSNGRLNSAGVSLVRTIFAQRLLSLGYPQLTKNYGISNGRGNNSSGTKNAGNGVQWNNLVQGSQIFQGGAEWYVDNFKATVYAANTTSQDKVLQYNFSGFKPIKIFGIPASYWQIHGVGIKIKAANSYDEAPGGYETTQSQFVYNLNSKTTINLWTNGFSISFYNSGGANTATNSGHFGHNFIPVTSALDLQNQSYGSANNFQSANMFYNIDANILNPGVYTGNTLSTPSLSPFIAVLTSTSDCAGGTCNSLTYDPTLSVNGYNNPLSEGNNWNLWHEASLSSQTTLFLLRKILNTNTFPACTTSNSLCVASGTISISGPTGFCTTATYTLLNSYAAYGSTITWSFPNGTTSIVSGQGTPTVNVTKIGDYSEVATVTLTNSCGTSTYTKNIVVGSPNNLTGTYSTNTATLPIQTVNFVPVGNIYGQFTWPSVSNISITHSGSGTWNYSTMSTFSFYLNSGQQMVLTFNGTGTCGPVTVTRPFIQSSMGGFSITATPNPTVNNLIVNINPTNTIDSSSTNKKIQSLSVQSTSPITTLSLYSMNSTTLIKQWNYHEAESLHYNLNIAGLKSGIYILKVDRNNISKTIEIMVK